MPHCLPISLSKLLQCLALSAWGFSGSLHAAGAAARPQTGQSFVGIRKALPHVLIKERIRVFYTTEGMHAVQAADANGNSIPDQVEDVATQTWAAWQLWTSLGFHDPLKTERYRGVAWLDVHLLSKALLQFNGVAYDEIQRFGRPNDPPRTGSLCFDVATSVTPHANLAPSHELFHVIQNSTTYFKNRWFTEGTARWSERGLGKGAHGSVLNGAPWPPDGVEMAKVFTGTYDTVSSYWEPLLMQNDKRGTIPREQMPQALLEARYVNGQPVLKDLDLTGWELMREILFALGRADDDVKRERHLGNWPEAEQKSNANDAIIHRVVLETVRKADVAK